MVAEYIEKIYLEKTAMFLIGNFLFFPCNLDHFGLFDNINCHFLRLINTRYTTYGTSVTLKYIL